MKFFVSFSSKIKLVRSGLLQQIRNDVYWFIIKKQLNTQSKSLTKQWDSLKVCYNDSYITDSNLWTFETVVFHCESVSFYCFGFRELTKIYKKQLKWLKFNQFYLVKTIKNNLTHSDFERISLVKYSQNPYLWMFIKAVRKLWPLSFQSVKIYHFCESILMLNRAS